MTVSFKFQTCFGRIKEILEKYSYILRRCLKATERKYAYEVYK